MKFPEYDNLTLNLVTLFNSYLCNGKLVETTNLLHSMFERTKRTQ